MANKRLRPATTPQAREQQLGALAYDLAERQLLEGTASAQVVVHFLKANSIREKKELAKLENENLLAQARIESTSSENRQEILLQKALEAFTEYKGGNVEETDDY